VLAVEFNEDAVAYSYEILSAQGVANDSIGDEPVVVMWQPGVASALDRGFIADGRDVGTLVVYSRELNGETLTFQFENGTIIDAASGSAWDVFGKAVEGPRAGEQLKPIVGVSHFWFSWAAFKPETRVYESELEAQSNEEVTVTPTAEMVSEENVAVLLEKDFEVVVYTGATALGGEHVMFSDLFAQGKPVLVEFWAGLCPVCRRALPDTQAAYLAYKDEVLFVGLDIGVYAGLGNEDDARALYGELGLSFPTGAILEPSAMQTYRVTGIPTTLYFKSNGELFGRGGGIVGVDVLSEELDALILASQ
jgi:thiol-disulfide isomerase/thioredoxin